MSETEYWIRPGRGTAIALLHGLGAEDPQAYWQAFIEVLKNDERLQGFGLFVWKYPTHKRPGMWSDIISTLKMKTPRRTAPSIEHVGDLWDSTYRTQFREYQHVALICHSMAGLVVKSWVVNTLERGHSVSLTSLRHIAFYATPHNGSLATLLTHWNVQLKEMLPDSSFIEHIVKGWHDHVVAWKDKDPGPADRQYNRYIPHIVIAGVNDGVVTPNFAKIEGMQTFRVPGDHSQVIQPDDTGDTRYKIWVDNWERVHPLSASSIEQRHTNKQEVKYAARLIPKPDFSTSGWLGKEERKYVFVADYDEQRGRTLEQILRSLWNGDLSLLLADLQEQKRDLNIEWIALIFEMGVMNYRHPFDLRPATWKAVFVLLLKLKCIDASGEEREKLRHPPIDYYSSDQRYWKDAVAKRIPIPRYSDPENILSSYFGLEDGNFGQTGVVPVSPTALMHSRVFFVKNVAINGINYRTQELGSLDEKVILRSDIFAKSL